MKKSVDIDVLLANDQLEMVLGGTSYLIEDVSLSIFMMTSSGSEEKGDILHEQLASILKTDKKKLKKDVGLRAAAFALKEIRNWITETSMEEEEKKNETPSKNP